MLKLGVASAKRREELKKHVVVNPVLQSVKIEKYYDMADRALDAAQTAQKTALLLPAGTWREAHARQVPLGHAYVFWKRFAVLTNETIPSHGYYKSPTTRDRKRKLNGDVRVAVTALETIVDAMDRDERLLDAYRAEAAALAEKERAEAQKRAGLERLRAEKRARDDARRAEEAARLRREAEARAAEARETAEARDVAARFERLARDDDAKRQKGDLVKDQSVAYFRPRGIVPPPTNRGDRRIAATPTNRGDRRIAATPRPRRG